MISKALLSSKDMCWCTPKDFFQKLDEEFHFVLDAAATDRSAKCKLYFTPEIDALAQSWDVGGRYTATHHTGDRSEDGSGKHTKNRAGVRTRS